MMLLLAAGLLFALLWLGSTAMLAGAGRRSLSRQPVDIELRPLPAGSWRDPAAAERLAQPLREKGFADLGVFEVLPLAGTRLGVLVHEASRTAAFLNEPPKLLGLSLELNVRYEDGTTTMLVNHKDRKVPKPPFFRVIYDESGADSGALYERLLRERAPQGIKAITAANVLPEYKRAWARMMVWLKNRGLSAAEVAAIHRVAPRDPKL